jgi:hypothetical protein
VNIKIRRSFVIVEERKEEAGRIADQPLRRVAAVAVVENPYAGRYVEDLTPMIDASVRLGQDMAQLALSASASTRCRAMARAELSG